MENTISKRLNIIQKACEDKKADNIVDIDISGKTALADHFVIVSGNSKPQLDAIKSEIDSKMSKEGYEPQSIEGQSESGWIIMDYDDIIVHIFNHDRRSFYNIERLWGTNET